MRAIRDKHKYQSWPNTHMPTHTQHQHWLATTIQDMAKCFRRQREKVHVVWDMQRDSTVLCNCYCQIWARHHTNSQPVFTPIGHFCPVHIIYRKAAFRKHLFPCNACTMHSNENVTGRQLFGLKRTNTRLCPRKGKNGSWQMIPASISYRRGYTSRTCRVSISKGGGGISARCDLNIPGGRFPLDSSAEINPRFDPHLS